MGVSARNDDKFLRQLLFPCGDFSTLDTKRIHAMSAPKILRPSNLLISALLLAAVAFAFLAVQKSETLPQRRPYLIGEIAKEEVVAPRKIAVVDPVATEVRRETEAAKIPVVFHFDKSVSDRAVANFSTDFIFTREKFLDAVEQAFKTRTLTTNDIGPQFQKVFNKFQAKNKSYPVGVREAESWAQHSLDENRVKQMCAKLRRASEQFIRPDTFSPTNLTFQVRIISDKETASSLELVKQQSQLLRRTNVVGLAKVRKEVMAVFEKENRAVQKYMANNVQATCAFDAELTQQFRAEKTNAIWAKISFAAGQTIVRRGETIDAKMKAALDELKIQRPMPTDGNPKQIWLWTSAIACVGCAFVIGIIGLTRRPRNRLVPAGNVLVLPTVGGINDDLRAELIPHLARGLMNKFVRALISQRSELMRTQQTGTDQLAEIEQRLDQISTRLENRQVFYETRINQLEKELAAAEEENRELIRAKIHEARQNLEWAKTEASGGK
jgi:membrane-associated HD superfamily phosphohydrolase